MKQNELAKTLKMFLIITSVMLAVVAFFIVPSLGQELVERFPEFNRIYYPALVFIWITMIPFYGALFEGLKIAVEISKDNSFSERNIKSLNKIRLFSLLECILYAVAMIFLFAFKLLHLAVLIVILAIIFMASCISVVTAVLAHLVQKAYDIKNENDLTI